MNNNKDACGFYRIINHSGTPIVQLIESLPFILMCAFYLGFVVSKRKKMPWPLTSTCLFMAGSGSAILEVSGSIGFFSRQYFTAHMLGHLLLGMLAPLLMVVAAPMTLMFRTLKVQQARLFVRIFKSPPVRILSNPLTASILNIGVLWIIYTTSLFDLMHRYMLIHIVVHFHVFIAGYLFTASIIYIDPVSHRKSFVYRAVILLTALSFHGILAKYIYIHPPSGVDADEAKTAALLMYYGGDLIDLALIYIFCLQWYRTKRPRLVKITTPSAE